MRKKNRLKKTVQIIMISLMSIAVVKFSYTKVLAPQQTQVEDIDKSLVPIIISPIENVKFSSPITGFIDKIPLLGGALFKKDDPLVEYNCTVMRAEKEKAAAIAAHLGNKARDMEKLYHLGGASRTEYSEAQSQAIEAKEDLVIKSYIVSQCILKAPFDGQVVSLFASEHEYIEQGKPLIEVVNLSLLEVKLILPSEWLGWLKIGTEFNIKLNETDENYPAKITRLTYAIDPVSNTFTAYASFIENGVNVKPGMSGYADFGPRK